MNDPVRLACLVQIRLAYISHSTSRADDDFEIRKLLNKGTIKGAYLNSINANKKGLNFNFALGHYGFKNRMFINLTIVVTS